MPKIIILGSSNAVPSRDHENTHLVIVGEERTILVDCVSNPIVRLEQAGVDFNDLDRYCHYAFPSRSCFR